MCHPEALRLHLGRRAESSMEDSATRDRTTHRVRNRSRSQAEHMGLTSDVRVWERCMTQSPNSPPPETRHHEHNVAFDALFALSMAVGRGSTARRVVGVAELTSDDRVVDIGCGPGVAVRIAARRCAHATGVDPSPASLSLGRRLNAIGGTRNAELIHGSAEAIPLPDCSATVVWALRSVHHWGDRARGLAEAFRVLTPRGRLLLAERLVKPGVHGGMTVDQITNLENDVMAAGFMDVRRATLARGRRTMNVVLASRGLIS